MATAAPHPRVRAGCALAAGCLLVAAAACLARSGAARRPDALLETAARAPARAPAGELRRLGGLVSEVAAVKHALLALEDRRAAARREQLLAARPARLPGHLPLPAPTDSFDYGAATGHQRLGQGEWLRRDARDDRLEMIPGRAALRNIDRAIALHECRYPDCVTRSGLPPGAVLYPGACSRAAPRCVATAVASRAPLHAVSRAA